MDTRVVNRPALLGGFRAPLILRRGLDQWADIPDNGPLSLL
jgi:hypothetical protein